MDTFGEHPAARGLVQHAAWLRRLASALVGDAASADDLVQETFVAALSHPPDDGTVPRTWLARVARNAAKQRFRTQGRRARREAESAGPRPFPDPGETAERLDSERRLTEELARLDEPFRTTLMLRFYDGLAPAEIAQRTGTPGGTVRWRLQRGLELLRERLDGRFGERRAWCLLLLPIARSQPFALASAGASTIALPGALAMSTFWKFAAGAACLVAIAVGLMLAGVLPSPLPRSGADASLELAFRPLAPGAPVAHAEAPSERVEDGDERRDAAHAVPAELPAAVEASLASASVEARVVDAAGVPLAGVELRELREDDRETVARSAADGRVALAVALDRSPCGVRLELRSPGYASRCERPVLTAGALAHLGTLVLAPGGVITGRVLDAEGAAVAGARVAFETATESRQRLEQRRIQGGFDSVPAARTDAHGRFELVGLEEGFVRLSAEAPGFLASFTAPVEVRAGQETYGVELELDALPAENLVRGVVLDPDGAPVARARLEFRHESKEAGIASSGDREADSAGRFEFRLPSDARLSLIARDPGRRHAPASAVDVGTGGPELVLRLARAASVALVVRGAGGAAVEEYGFEVLATDESAVHEHEPRAARPGGTADFVVPGGAFLVAIDAPGHERALVGPFEPEGLGSTLEARLVPVPGLRGRVLLGPDGEPAAGARVSLRELATESDYVVDGFPARLRRGDVDRSVCDAQGAFLLTVRSAGEYVVRAERDGRAPAESAVISVGSGLAAQDVELVLGFGGAIEGRVKRTDGGDPAGVVLGLSRGDGFGRTLRVGPGGTYRFERLTPGPWWIEVRSEELQPGTTSIMSGNRPEREDELASQPTCEVLEGETTWHDVEYGGDSTCALDGHLEVDGQPAQAWKVRLVPHERALFDGDGPEVALDVGGRFRIGTDRPGKYWLVFSGAFEEHGEQVVVDVVELAPGAVPWERSFTTGALVVEGVDAWSGEGFPGCAHYWDGPGELLSMTVITGDGAGVARVPAVPSGSARLVRPDPANPDFASWETLVEVAVPAGGEARVRLP